jgi:hypothetical protein
MTDDERESTERATDATEQPRRDAADRTIEDQPESGRVADTDDDDEKETAF